MRCLSSIRRWRKWSSLAGLSIALGVLGLFALIAWSATLFKDDFTEPAEGWLVGPDPQGNARWSFHDGEYQVMLARPEALSWSLAPIVEAFPEFCAEIAARQLPVAPGEVGLAFGFRSQDEKEIFNTFGIFPDGSYRLGRFAQGQLANLPVATAPLKLYPSESGRFNNLRVVARDGELQFYGNGKLLATLKLEQLQVKPEGGIGFFGRSGAEPFVTGRFDFIRVMTPDCEP